MMEDIDYDFKKITPIHRRALERNRYLQEAHVPEWMTNGNITLIQKEHLKWLAQTTTDYNLLSDDV